MNTLALQGGGTRGIMQAVILDALEQKAGKPAWRLFDSVGGTSVGSIVGAAVALGVPAADIVKFFTASAPKIFSGGSWLLPRFWSSAKYSPDNLRAALLAVFGDKTLADCKIPFIATAMEMVSGRPVYFQSYHVPHESPDEIIITDASLVDVCMASSAAQSYFPAHRMGNLLFWDGGNTGFNAPDMLVLYEAPPRDLCPDLAMLSIGNGHTPWPYAKDDLSNPGIATVADVTLDIAYSGPEAAMVWLARQQLGPNHYRLNPTIANYAIDDASTGTLAAMQNAALAEIQAHPEIISAFIR